MLIQQKIHSIWIKINKNLKLFDKSIDIFNGEKMKLEDIEVFSISSIISNKCDNRKSISVERHVYNKNGHIFRVVE